MIISHSKEEIQSENVNNIQEHSEQPETNEECPPNAVNMLINEISEMKKPIIVHNGFFDLLQLYDKFYGNLPSLYKKFNENLLERFPVVFDTKHLMSSFPHISSDLQRKQTTLANAFISFRALASSFEHKIDEGFGNYNFRYIRGHEAGYDAMMTANIFVNCLSKLRLSNFLNKIFLKNF